MLFLLRTNDHDSQPSSSKILVAYAVPQWAQGPLSSPALASSALAPRQQAASSAPRSSAPAPAPSTSAAPPAPPSLQAPERSRSQGDSGSELVSPAPLGPRGDDPVEIERYWAKVRAGPEPGTRCALCHQPDAPLLARRELGPGGRARGALGPLVLVQPTRKTYAWVHDQCLRWSPEVAEGPAEGIRDLAGRAVLRGRGLRCKMCSAKGATLGCMTHCPTSLHLPCALRSKCLLVVQPYRVACAKHAKQMALQSSDEEEEEEEPAGAREAPRPAPSGASARGPPSRGPSSRGPSSLVSSPRRRYEVHARWPSFALINRSIHYQLSSYLSSSQHERARRRARRLQVPTLATEAGQQRRPATHVGPGHPLPCCPAALTGCLLEKLDYSKPQQRLPSTQNTIFGSGNCRVRLDVS